MSYERGRFETTPEYVARFNQAAQKGDRRYQAGVAYLKDYNADGETLLVNLKWQAAWLKQLFGTPPKQGRIQIAPFDARTLRQEGK
jgi:hypothetical protein